MPQEAERIVFESVIDDQGRFHPEQALAVRARLARWHGRRVLVTVSRWIKPKTLPQLGYYFGVVLPYWAEHAGYTQDELHEQLKLAYLEPVLRISEFTGEERSIVPSLRDVNVEQMSSFLDRLVREAALQGIRLPPPNEKEFAL